jgi:hypothetical protein
MIQHLFSTQIWKSPLNIKQSIKDEILKSIEKNYQNHELYLNPLWNCKVHSTIFENNEIDYSGIMPYFRSEYEKFAKEINLNYHNYSIKNIWYNYYVNGSNQEYHDHISKNWTTSYSMVYFLKINDEHPKLTFNNYTNYHAYYSSNPKLKNLYSSDNCNNSIIFPNWSLNANEGDLVIFPAYIQHGVFVQKINEPRITISLNIELL